ncbi:four-jointed box protein 1-like [Ruditapes philippinarum]|uniref:four-jointed box protein 1-like n=1 Tax=Ruditapes philippinarum TaxID=129788 RepID=UPI00295B26E6|nr:four-jointed box protein 1-like [Ruditapes philippinarum]
MKNKNIFSVKLCCLLCMVLIGLLCVSFQQNDNFKKSSLNLKFQNTRSNNLTLLKDGIFWNDYAETFVPKGMQQVDSIKFIKKISHQRVVKVINANRSVCGLGGNAIVKLNDGSTMCVRHQRTVANTKICAESFAFYLSRLLGMDNVPEVVISNISSPLWKGTDFINLGWREHDLVAMIRWLHHTSHKVFMPSVIRDAVISGKPVNSDVIYNTNTLKSNTSISELIQWGTMIIFDNLIKHCDRLKKYRIGVGNRLLNRVAHNTLMSSNGKIWLIDNESAFFHNDPQSYYTSLNRKMLRTLCIFEKFLVTNLIKLSKHPSAFHHVWKYAITFEPSLVTFEKNINFNLSAISFNNRLDETIEWINRCKLSSTLK